MKSDSKLMAMALSLAKKGGRAVAPNPLVGAVIAKNGRVIGRGFHERFGGPHAEVNALRSVKNKTALKGATLVVTLEPCRHFGKTPPCLDAVEAAGITRIVAGSVDPFQKKFTRKPRVPLRFIDGPLADACETMNRFFFTWVRKKRPFVTMKVAVSANGCVAGPGGKPVHLTTRAQDRQVHAMRAQHQAILVGINAVINDDPQLNVRLAKGPDPLRVVLDSRLRIPLTAKVLRDKNVLVATTKNAGRAKKAALLKKGFSLWESPGRRVSLTGLLKALARRGIASVLVEPGPTLFRAFKKAGLADELVVFHSATIIKNGLPLRA